LIISPGGEASFLSHSPSLPLGLEQDASFDERCVKFPPGATVLAYTDGLIERRTHPIDAQLERLRSAVAGAGINAEVACDCALAAFPPDGGDDVALLAFQAAPLVRDVFDVSPHPATLATARGLLREWLANRGVERGPASELVLAAGEALTNAVAHSGTRRNVEVQLALEDGNVRITVRDFGRWATETSGSDSGRGLPLMAALTDHLDVASGESGTTVTLVRRVMEPPTAEPERPVSLTQPA
jgi:anti-sigma regulatory factor (Ser/Thr protein kinase)